MAASARTSSCAQGSDWPKWTFATRYMHWEPETVTVQTDFEQITMVTPKALQAWPVLPAGFNIHFAVDSIPLSLYDQGREVCGQSRAMGVGVKVTAPRFHSQKEQVVASAGQKLLSFVIVARTVSTNGARAIHLCKVRGVGGERGYGLLHCGQSVLVYDIARSTAWFANAARSTQSWYLGKRPSVNLKLCVCHRHEHRWLAWFVATKDLHFGEPLFAAYGIGSSHYGTIEAEAAERRKGEPVCNQKRRKRCEQLVLARKKRC